MEWIVANDEHWVPLSKTWIAAVTKWQMKMLGEGKVYHHNIVLPPRRINLHELVDWAMDHGYFKIIKS